MSTFFNILKCCIAYYLSIALFPKYHLIGLFSKYHLAVISVLDFHTSGSSLLRFSSPSPLPDVKTNSSHSMVLVELLEPGQLGPGSQLVSRAQFAGTNLKSAQPFSSNHRGLLLYLCQVMSLLLGNKQGFCPIVQDSLSASLPDQQPICAHSPTNESQPFKHVARIVPIQLAVVDQAFIELQHRGCAVPCPRAYHLPAPVNLRRFLCPKTKGCFGDLHAEQGVVCHLDRKDGTFLPIEEVPDLKHPINSGSEEHRKPWIDSCTAHFTTWQDSKHPQSDGQGQVSST